MISSVLMLISLCSATPEMSEVGASFSPKEFQGWFDRASESRIPLPPRVTIIALKYRYVFVGGFLNERMPGYFTANVRELRTAGVSRDAIFQIFPSSHESIDGNAAEVRARFEEIAALGPEKLVVIAHSRGACDTLAFALKNPEFVRKHVHSMFLLQGPFGGTLLADYVAGKGSRPDGAMPWRDRAVLSVMGRLEGFFRGRGKLGGLSELRRQPARDLWTSLLREHRAAVAIVSPKIYFITAATHPSSLRFIQRATGSYLHIEDGPNDGMVALSDQSLAEVGTIVANLIAGHHDLTHARTSTKETRGYPRALTQAILISLAHGQVQPEPAQTPRTPEGGGGGEGQKGRRVRLSASTR